MAAETMTDQVMDVLGQYAAVLHGADSFSFNENGRTIARRFADKLTALRSQAEPAVEIEVFESSVANKRFTAVSAKLLDKTFPAGKHFLYAVPPEARPEGQDQRSEADNGRVAMSSPDLQKSSQLGHCQSSDHLAAQREALNMAAAAIPTNWCDELLSGKGTSIPLDCPGVERLLNGIKARILALLPSAGRVG